MIALCVVCGKEFEKRGKIIVCSDKCRAERRCQWFRDRDRKREPERSRKRYAANPEKARERSRKKSRKQDRVKRGARFFGMSLPQYAALKIINRLSESEGAK